MLTQKRFFFSLFFLFLIYASAQNKVDSLLQVLSLEKVDSNKVKLYGQLGGLYKNSIPDTAIYYYSKGLEISKNNNHKLNIARGLIKLGNVYETKSDFKKALSYNEQALAISDEIDKKNVKANILVSIALIYEKKGNYDKAMGYYLKAFEIFNKNNDNIGLAMVYNNMGLIYYNKGQHDRAIETYQKAVKIYEKTKDDANLAISFINIGRIFMGEENYDKAITYYDKAIFILIKTNNLNDMGIAYLNEAIAYMGKENLEKATEYNNKAFKIFKKIGNSYILSYVYDNFSYIYTQKGNSKKSIEYTLLSLLIAEELGDKLGISYKLGSIASDYNSLKQHNTSITYATKSLVLAKEIGSLEYQMNAYKQLSDAYTGKKNYKKALENKVLQTQLKDSLFNIEKTEKINDIQTKYETEKKDLEIANKALAIDNLEKKAQRNKIFMLASALILGLGILALVLFYRNRLTKEKYKAELFNQKLLRSQMNPHFIFNTLTSIQSYMFEKDTLKAAMYLSSFSKLTRSILEGSRHDFVSLQEEYETNENYLKIQQMRYDSLFDYSISIDENIDPDHVQIAPMLIQPFIENSIKHGFKDIDYKGHLQIMYKKIDNKIQITIQDNGKGVTDNKEHTHKSHALSITKERLQILNRRSKEKITLSVENAIDKGYKVVFNVPLKVA